MGESPRMHANNVTTTDIHISMELELITGFLKQASINMDPSLVAILVERTVEKGN